MVESVFSGVTLQTLVRIVLHNAGLSGFSNSQYYIYLQTRYFEDI